MKSTFIPNDRLENFNMSQSTFAYLCDELRSSIEKNNTAMRKAIPADIRAALTLWFLATGADYRTTGYLFGISKSTVCLVSSDVCSGFQFRFGVEVGVAVSHTMPPQLTTDINYVFLGVTEVLMHVVFTQCSNDYRCLTS